MINIKIIGNEYRLISDYSLENIIRSIHYPCGWAYSNIDMCLRDITTDLKTLQDSRNDFAHFRFDTAKLEETKELLDKYISLMAQRKIIKKQKEQNNPTSAQFIKNIEKDNVDLKETDFEKAIEKVAFSKVKKD